MRHINIEVICDQCGETTDERHSENLTITYQNKNYDVDLCHPCVDALTQLGRVLPGKTQKRELTSDSWPCQVAGCAFIGKTARGLANHMTRTHRQGRSDG